MRAVTISILAGVVLLVASGVKADELASANAAFDKHDYARAFELYEPLARTGNAPAQSAIGSMYFFGNGVAKDWVRAYLWFRLAAQTSTATAIVAETNRQILARQMTAMEVRAAAAMADECRESRYAHCGLTRFAER